MGVAGHWQLENIHQCTIVYPTHFCTTSQPPSSGCDEFEQDWFCPSCFRDPNLINMDASSSVKRVLISNVTAKSNKGGMSKMTAPVDKFYFGTIPGLIVIVICTLKIFTCNFYVIACVVQYVMM